MYIEFNTIEPECKACWLGKKKKTSDDTTDPIFSGRP